MKKFLIASILILAGLNLSAQPPQGGRGGGEGRPNRPPMGQKPGQSEDKMWLSNFPDIPDLTLKQREKLGSTLTKEMKDVSKQMQKKHELDIEINNNLDLSKKDVDKNQKKIVKIDKKIEKIKEKSDKKVRSILSTEQYLVFVEKKGEFKFRRFGYNKEMPSERKTPQHSEDGQHPPLPER